MRCMARILLFITHGGGCGGLLVRENCAYFNEQGATAESG